MNELEIYKKAFKELINWRKSCMDGGFFYPTTETDINGNTKPGTIIIPGNRVKHLDHVLTRTKTELQDLKTGIE